MIKRKIQAEVSAWLEWCRERNATVSAVETKQRTLSRFVNWCHERGLDYPQDIIRPILERYQRHLYQHRKRNGYPLSAYTQRTQLAPIIAWFRWGAH